MERSDFHHLLTSNQPLFQAILAFNQLSRPPAGLAPAALAETIDQNPRLWRYFPSSDLPPAFWDFRVEPHRLALLDDLTLTRLAQAWGASVWAPRLAGLINRPEALRVRESLGPELYAYALKRGRFQLGSLRESFLTGEAAPDSLDRARLEQCGLSAINQCWQDAPAPLQARLSGRWRPLAAGELLPPDLRRQTWAWLKKILLTEVAPQWRPCFT